LSAKSCHCPAREEKPVLEREACPRLAARLLIDARTG
jgi:hypothetical protein